MPSNISNFLLEILYTFFFFFCLFLPLPSWEGEESVARNSCFPLFNGYIKDIDLFWSCGPTGRVHCYFPSKAFKKFRLNQIIDSYSPNWYGNYNYHTISQKTEHKMIYRISVYILNGFGGGKGYHSWSYWREA